LSNLSCLVLRKRIAGKSTSATDSAKLKGKEKADETAADEEAASASDAEGEEVEAEDAMEELAVSAASKK